jgi:hypothetical protein
MPPNNSFNRSGISLIVIGKLNKSTVDSRHVWAAWLLRCRPVQRAHPTTHPRGVCLFPFLFKHTLMSPRRSILSISALILPCSARRRLRSANSGSLARRTIGFALIEPLIQPAGTHASTPPTAMASQRGCIGFSAGIDPGTHHFVSLPLRRRIIRSSPLHLI